MLLTSRVVKVPRQPAVQSAMRRRRGRGFTLVELMIVVAIIAVLAILAVVGYRKLITSSHTSEATHMIGSIRVAQETFHSETGQYANISPGIGLGSLYPVQNDPPNEKKLTSWGMACGVCADPQGWNRLPVHPDGAVRFAYATVAGVANTAPGVAVPTQFPGTVQWPSQANITSDWYIITAFGDLDGNGTYVVLMGTSWQKDILVANEGE